jgi:hypothetical protein
MGYYKNAIITEHYHISSDCVINPRINLMSNLLYYNTLNFYIDDLSGYGEPESCALVSSLDYGQLKINGEDISVISIFVKDSIVTFNYDSLYNSSGTNRRCYTIKAIGETVTSDDEFKSIDMDFDLKSHSLDMRLISKSIHDSFSNGVYLNVLPLLKRIKNKKESKVDYFIFRNKYIYRIPIVYTFTFLALLKFRFPKELIDIIIDTLF